MMLPKLQTKSPYRAVCQRRFGGYDCRKSAPDGSLITAMNLSTADTPLLRTAPGRVSSPYTGVCAVSVGEDVYYLAPAEQYYDLYKNNTPVAQAFGNEGDSLVAFAGYIIAYPSGEYYRIPRSPGEVGTTGPFRISYTVDESLSVFTVTENTVRVPVSFLHGRFSDYLHVGDEITVTVGHDSSPVSTVITALSEETVGSVTHSVMETEYEEFSPGEYAFGQFTHENPLCGFSVFFVHNNRLWGCHERKIVCSKMGDPFNFNVFSDLSTGSWTWEMGENDPFTAGCSFNGYPTFFTEASLVRVFGEYPAQFTVKTQTMPGVMGGCEKSPAPLGNYLYYYSPRGVMEYNGSAVRCVSDALGYGAFHNALGGSDGRAYYLVADVGSAGAEDIRLFVYREGLWAEESVLPVSSLFYHGNTMHYLGGALSQMAKEGKDVSWLWEFHNYRYDTPEEKELVRILLRGEFRGSLKVEIRYDNGEYETLGEYTAEKYTPFHVPLIPRRCNVYSLRLSGTGQATLYDVTYEVRRGSTIYR